MQLIVGCQEVSYQTVQSLIGLEVFLILFPFIVSSWSLRGGQSPVVAAHGYCGGKGGAGERHNLGFICLAAGSPLPLGHSAVSQGRAVAIPSVAAAAGEHGLGLRKHRAAEFPKGPWRYLHPHLQGKVWPSGRRAGLAVGEGSGLILPSGELGFSLSSLERLCLESDSKSGTILMSPPSLASGCSYGCFCSRLGFNSCTT